MPRRPWSEPPGRETPWVASSPPPLPLFRPASQNSAKSIDSKFHLWIPKKNISIPPQSLDRIYLEEAHAFCVPTRYCTPDKSQNLGVVLHVSTIVQCKFEY
jgi:hypothetical protein